MNRNDNRNGKRKRKRESLSYYLFRVLIFLLVIIGIAILIRLVNKWEFYEPGPETPETTVTPTPPGPDAFITSADLTDLSEDKIYTFFQGPVAWNTKQEYSGSWCEEVLAGQRFSVFGCGHCCMANIYSTLTPFICSPVDMFDLAKEVTEYAPSSEAGAIAWEYIQEALDYTGIESSLCEKDESYADFQQKMSEGITAIVNVNSGDDDTYWQDTYGHYVNIWLYDQADDTVFLADSGSPGHNRQRIPLKYVYDAMKTSDSYQYLLVEGFYPNGNNWKHDGIEMDWNPPG